MFVKIFTFKFLKMENFINAMGTALHFHPHKWLMCKFIFLWISNIEKLN